MKTKNYCYLNGDLLQYDDCRMHISDLLFQRGYGVFDYFRCRSGSIPWLDDYIDRLYNSVRLSGLDLPLNRKEFTSIISALREKNGDPDSAFKVIVTGGYSETLDTVTGSPNIIILNVPWNRPPAETFDRGVRLISSAYTRPDPEIKSLNYFNLFKHHRKMKEQGAIDVLYHNEMISEASRANVFLVKGGSVYTPSGNILKGVTRKQLLGAFRDIRVKDIPFERLYDFEEMFLSSTSRDITPVVAVDGRKIGKGTPGKVTLELIEWFRGKGW